MIWRPWIIFALAIGVMLVNVVLVSVEFLPEPVVMNDVRKRNEPLRTLDYRNNNRRSNFVVMGMGDELGDLVAKDIERFRGTRKAWKAILTEQRTILEPVFCPSDGLPQPYSALSVLVYEENKRRYPIEPSRPVKLEVRPWFKGAFVPGIYSQFELAESRKADATVMGVGALLASLENDALDGNPPFSTSFGGAWGYDRLRKKVPRVHRQVRQYFALMHFLTEIANDQDGICR